MQQLGTENQFREPSNHIHKKIDRKRKLYLHGYTTTSSLVCMDDAAKTQRFHRATNGALSTTKTHTHIWSTLEQRARVIEAASAAERRLVEREEGEWLRLRAAAEERLEDAPTTVMCRRASELEITVVRRILRGRHVTAFERQRFARSGR